MNKAEFIDALVDHLGDRKTALKALDAMLEEIQRAVSKGEKVSFAGFGVFEKRQRAARMARNPRTGEAVRVKKTVVPAFRPGQGFKELVTGEKKMGKRTVGKKSTARKTTAKQTAPAKKATTRKAAAKKTVRTATKATAKSVTKRVGATKATKKAAAKKTAKKGTRGRLSIKPSGSSVRPTSDHQKGERLKYEAAPLRCFRFAELPESPVEGDLDRRLPVSLPPIHAHQSDNVRERHRRQLPAARTNSAKNSAIANDADTAANNQNRVTIVTSLHPAISK